MGARRSTRVLISRFEQLRTIPSIRSRPVVSDYTQAKDPIFARTLVHDREVELYERLSVGLDVSVCRPDLTVYVDASNDVLLDRIRQRNRTYEVSIDGEYLDALRDAYLRHHNSTGKLQVLTVDTSALNLRSQSQVSGFYKKVLAAVSMYQS